jgi:site-specific recombinase XerD
MDAGVLGAEIGSFRLHLAAEGKAPKTIRLYTEAVAWFAAARLLGEAGKTGWEQADRRDVQEWMAWLLGRYSDAYASNQYRALQQFFKWLSAEEDLPDPMDGLHPPKVTGKLVPVFAGTELALLERACAGRGFAQRRDAAIIAVLKASGIRLAELAGIRYDPHDPRRGDLDLWQREITVRGKGGRPRIVKISHDAARAVDRYLRVRARHPQAWRAQLWLGAGSRGPLTASGNLPGGRPQGPGGRSVRCGRTGTVTNQPDQPAPTSASSRRSGRCARRDGVGSDVLRTGCSVAWLSERGGVSSRRLAHEAAGHASVATQLPPAKPAGVWDESGNGPCMCGVVWAGSVRVLRLIVERGTGRVTG